MAIIAVEVLLLVGIVLWARSGPQSGIAVKAGSASIAVSPQRNVTDRITVDKVKTPVQGWVVVQAADKSGMPGDVIGSAQVHPGENDNVAVTLDTTSVPRVAYISLLADEGKPGVLEFTPGSMGNSADKPIVAGSSAVVVKFAIVPFSRNVGAGEALLGTATLAPTRDAVRVSRAVAPRPSWLVIATPGAASGGPGVPLGWVPIPAGESVEVTIPITGSLPVGGLATGTATGTAGATTGTTSTTPSQPPLPRSIPASMTVFLFADQGVKGVFEYNPSQPSASPDQPYEAAGIVVSTPVLPAPGGGK